LNPERISMPDIDTDFCDKRRDEVIDYVRSRYGEKNVAQIGTFGTLKARSAIRDVARVTGFTPTEADQVAKLVPEGLDVTIESGLRSSPEFRDMANSTPRHQRLVEMAQALEGAIRQTGVHAAGVVIGDRELSDLVPLMRPQKGAVCTQFDMNIIERIGLVKMDFLGLKTLSVIDDAVANVRKTRGHDVNWKQIPLDDPETYELLSEARTAGIFQLESRGMKDILKKLKPGRFNDLVPVLGLYRPGPLGSGLVDDFIKRRHHPDKVRYDNPLVEPILKETYGIIIYQEQAMKIANVLCGFTMGQADTMRKAMGKKNAQLMAKLEKDFMDGATERGIDADVAETLWRKIEQFAGYGFNKSHTVAYALLTFRTAYLKAHYPPEFMAAALSNEIGDTDKISFFVRDCRALGIEVLPPDINESGEHFSVVNGNIRYGLAAIKNLGAHAVQILLKARDEGGRFKDLMDFCERIGAGEVSARTLQTLIRAGAMDCFGATRRSLIEVHEEAIRKASAGHADRVAGQLSLLDGIAPETRVRLDIPDLEENPRDEVLREEAELLGLSLSGHLLDECSDTMGLLMIEAIDTLAERTDLSNLRLAGVVRDCTRRTSRNGNPYAQFQLEDRSGSVEVMVFESMLEECGALIQNGNVVVVKGDGEVRGDSVTVRPLKICSLDDALEDGIESIDIYLPAEKADTYLLTEIRALLRKAPGRSRVRIILETHDQGSVAIETGNEFLVRPGKELREAVSKAVSEEALRYRPRNVA
jgi:DNA polymerase-3 subunit alpha